MDPSSASLRPREPRRGRRTAVTLSDVAAAAGVSPITVSRALNTPETVSEVLRGRINATVEALGYVPNRMAGALASAKTRVIPVIVPSLSNVVFVEVIEGIQETIEAAGYQMLLGSTDYDLDREAALASTLLGWAPPGVLLAGLRHLPRTATLLKNADVPVVEFMEYGARCIDMNVGLSHVRAGAVMAAHLLERGYRRIGFVGTRMRDDYRARQRYDGMRRHIAEVGGASDILFEYPWGPGQEVGWHALADVLAADPQVDALFFANDEMAVGAVLRAQREGIAVPGRVAVAGFNGLPMSALVTPALTTITSPRKEIGKQAATMLLSRINGTPPAQRRIDVGFVLEARSST
ncbi:MAG: GntR family transcriptional regulator [Acidiphilium sp. 37-64-53]|uniref:LacI family DNA-binding transcriptional regulator n=1 Tax=Acidiphilium TaxID=522 RepID=UPI000BC4FAA9|nr:MULTISPECIES: LacI family DNA-binding transcriptional regulator [Acidiphilium]OYW00978.1 MAG: GntR family transcriptional regulator [Acidiphilium sp. 37-64-53]OZB30307.1 MAG: GntR family transcriptional regulator [Acidiphilium sp. 34-64-41]HQT86046.1 LacI family DNA-binding transcriptional regulator [Acidiphilium rubrum]